MSDFQSLIKFRKMSYLVCIESTDLGHFTFFVQIISKENNCIELKFHKNLTKDSEVTKNLLQRKEATVCT